MYQWQLGDRISFVEGEYGWYGIVTGVQDRNDGHRWYQVLLNQACWRAYGLYMNLPNSKSILVCDTKCYL